MEYFVELSYFGLFLIAFAAATILPLSSEVVLSALLMQGLSPYWLVIVASIGNVLGSLLNYGLGYWASTGVIRRWLRMTSEDVARAEQRFGRFGLAALLLAWVPIIGDPITVAAGFLRVRLAWFVVLVTLGKVLRYVIVTQLVLTQI